MTTYRRWGIADAAGGINPELVYRTRDEAIRFIEQTSGKPWSWWEAIGWSVVRVEVTVRIAGEESGKNPE